MKQSLRAIFMTLCFAPTLFLAQIPAALQNQLNTSTTAYFNGKSTRGLSASVYYKNSNAYLSMCRGISHGSVSIQPNMYFSIASASKILSACAILKLQELGLLDINDTIGKYIPNVSPNVSNQITIKELLQHRSGTNDYIIQRGLDSMNADYNKFWVPQDLLQFVGFPLAPHGTTWNYCNTNYLLSGMLIEQVSGQSFLQAINNLVLTPAGLDSITLLGFEPMLDSMAHAWDHGVITPYTGDITGLPHTSLGCYSWAAGGWMGRSKDLVDMYRAIFVDKTVLNTTSLALLKSAVSTGYASPFNKYGLAVFIHNSSSLNAAHHTGSWLHLCTVGVDLDNENVAAVNINDTEGLSTSVNYSGLMIQLLTYMRNFATADITEFTDNTRNQILYEEGNHFYLKEKVKRLEVFDLRGNKISEEINVTSFNLVNQPAGLYVVHADNYIQKIIVKH